MKPQPRYWFPAKRYGWGWGPPVTWQGWVVVVVWFAALIAIAPRFLPTRPVAFGVCTIGMCLVLTVICYLTGEPPRWRGKE